MLDPIQMGLRITRLGCSRCTIEHRSLQTRSSSRNQCDPDFVGSILRSSTSFTYSSAFKEPTRSNVFSPNGGEFVRRSNHFWGRSRVELNFEALACRLRATNERIRTPAARGTGFFPLFVYLLRFFQSFLSRPSVQSITHYYRHKPLYIKRPSSKQYRTAFTTITFRPSII